MGRLTGHLLARFRTWDRSAQIALIIALLLVVLVLALGRNAPDDVRLLAIIGFFGLMIAIQVIVMWANRGMVTPFTQAQRLYLAGDLEGACALLEAEHAAGRIDFRALTLLGNAWRQLGDLEKSLAVLNEALTMQPNHHFSLYGFGRTLLVQGRYAEAAATLERAIDAGAPPVVHLDAGEALFRLGDNAAARVQLEKAADVADDAHRRLLTAYLLYQLDAGLPPSADLIRDGLPFWEASAARFSSTPYGEALAQDVWRMQTLLKEM